MLGSIYNVSKFNPEEVQVLKKQNEIYLGFRGPYFVVWGENTEPEYYASENYAERKWLEKLATT